MAISNRKSAAFVLTKEGKSSIFKQNDGITLNLKSFALFKDKNLKLKRLIESADFNYKVLEDLKYDYFNNENFDLEIYEDSLVTVPRIENGERILCLNVDVFNKNNTVEDKIYDGIIYFCNAFDEDYIGLNSISENQDKNTIYAIQYFYSNKITILANQDKRINFAIQLRFKQNNYEVIDLDIPADPQNGLRLYNDALSNANIKSKTVGTTRSLAIGNNSNETGSMVDIYSYDNVNQLTFASINAARGGPFISNSVDVRLNENTFTITGKNTKSVELFSEDVSSNTEKPTRFYALSEKIGTNDNDGRLTFINSYSMSVTQTDADSNSTYINVHDFGSLNNNNTVINTHNAGSEGNGSDDNVLINVYNIGCNGKHNTFINSYNMSNTNVNDFVSICNTGCTFTNISNAISVGHNLIASDVSDVILFGNYNDTIVQNDLFVLANGTSTKGINAFKVSKTGDITISDGTNAATISPTGISTGNDSISYETIAQVVNKQDTLNNINAEIEDLSNSIDALVANGLSNISFLLDVDNTFNVDEHVTIDEKTNNLLVTLHNPFDNEVTVTYRFRQKTAMFNPETATVTVGYKSTLQLMYINNDDYKGFIVVR